MKKAILLLLLSCLITLHIQAQVDFFGRSITGQSPNSINTYLIVGLANESSWVNAAANLQDFEHAARQINLFNLGINYTTQVLQLDSVPAIQINLDTVVGGGVWKNAFRLHAGLEYEAGDRQNITSASIGASRFRAGGLSVSLRHLISLFREGMEIELIPATAMDRSVFATVRTGLEGGYDSGFNISLEESGILQLITDHLVQDVADNNLTFSQYKRIEDQLHNSIRYQAPKNTGGSDWYLLGLIQGELYTTPLRNIPLRFSLSLELGLDLTRVRKRNQSRLALALQAAYLLY
jgi:hypothetical protein